MAKEGTPRTHVKAPHNQPFQLGAGSKNKTKRKAWWQLGKSNNRKTVKKEKEQE